ncbi:MAG: hypothetical protein JWP43_1394 [Ramlibacter sp.]|jgi:hypothetical protein|nr:hypothetical protein [Ramlibacter sp.]
MRGGAAALAALLASGVAGAQATGPTPQPDCPQAFEAGQRHLLGLWHAQFEGTPRGATLLLEPHPDQSESVRGEINRDGERSAVSGELDEGDFTLEESRNGVNISAAWLGEVVEGSCGREIRGTWRSETDKAERPFVLHKLGTP